jgi:NADPH:quinone reductase-like Zn-dependent oxidoreductase
MSLHLAWIAIGVAAILCLSVFWKKKPFIANLRGKHIFLTGASSGIGLAVVKQTLQQGAYLTIVEGTGSSGQPRACEGMRRHARLYYKGQRILMFRELQEYRFGQWERQLLNSEVSSREPN